MSTAFASYIGARPDPANIVIFGAGGDLSKRKLLPALAHMHRWNLIAPGSRIIGVVRQDWSTSHWRNYVHQALLTYAPDAILSQDQWRAFADMLEVVSGDLGDTGTYDVLREHIERNGYSRKAMFYLAIPPAWYGRVAGSLAACGLNGQEDGFRRIVIEKPFGMNEDSARTLNREVQASFDESQIYRIDHYLGKESVQNLMVFRFANTVLEPLWNRNFIDHVQITVAESIGIEYRAGYYEQAGALRDMIQSHLMQVMALVAMEPPVELGAGAVRDEKLKVLRAIRPFAPEDIARHTVRAQYGPGRIGDELVPAYRQEEGVAEDSDVETFAAVRFHIDNWRWQGVPFLLRTGKRLPGRFSEIAIRFRRPPQNLFNRDAPELAVNDMVFRLQPDEGMSLSMNAKQPGLTTRLRPLIMDAPYAMAGSSMPEAYETLLHDVILGEAEMFSRADEVEASWRIVDPILTAWGESGRNIPHYPAGSPLVPGADELMAGCEGGWRPLS